MELTPCCPTVPVSQVWNIAVHISDLRAGDGSIIATITLRYFSELEGWFPAASSVEEDEEGGGIENLPNRCYFLQSWREDEGKEELRIC